MYDLKQKDHIDVKDKNDRHTKDTGQKTLWPEYHNFLPDYKLFYVVFIKNWFKVNIYKAFSY